MSLINDALKRAKDSQKKESPTVTTHFMTVASHPRGMSWGLLLMAAVLLAGACFFIGLALAKRNSSLTKAIVVTTKSAEAPSIPGVAKTSPAPPTVPIVAATPPTSVKIKSPPTSRENASNAVAVTTPMEPPAPPQPKLQAVIFDPQNPSAIIDGKIVHVSDVLGDFRVRAILQNSILIEFGDGSMRKLNLGE